MRVSVGKAVFLLVSVAALEAQGEVVRCGTDDFGNAVCIGKNGVVTTVPQNGRAGGDDERASPLTGAGAERDGKNERSRCGIDPFGNKVCR